MGSFEKGLFIYAGSHFAAVIIAGIYFFTG